MAINDLESDKCPGPDGFPLHFYKFCWGFMKGGLLKIFNDFYTNSYFDWRLNTTHLSLIPKVLGACSLMDFGPISLLSGCYKILAKVASIEAPLVGLANRLKPILHPLVSELQGASIEGRQIQDISLMANEFIDSQLLSKKGWLFAQA